MTRFLAASVSLVALASAVGANAAELAVKAPLANAPPAPVLYDWSGPYLGLNAGAAWGAFDPRTSTICDGIICDSTPIVNAAGIQSINPLGFTGGLQAGYAWQWNHLVAGLEADFNYLHLNGEANSGAVHFLMGPRQAVISSYGDAEGLFTLRPRIGWAAGSWLFYATGGLAVTDINDDFLLTVNTMGGMQEAGRIHGALSAGYAAGGGIEAGITDRLSVKAEYLYLGFGRSFAETTANSHPAQVTTQSADLRADMVRFGFDYHLNGADPAAGPYAGLMAAAVPAWAAPIFDKSNWEFDAGVRTWFSSGTLGAANPLYGHSYNVLVSRLVFGDLDAVSGETYGRVDHSSGLFVKGYLGAGGMVGGHLNDEDFPLSGGYSNTLGPSAGSLGYGTIDLGYTFLKSPGAKVGAFVGYNYYAEHINAYDGQQLAGSPGGSGSIPNFIHVGEDDHFDALRLGLSTEYMLTDRLKFTGDAAYLPWADFRGQDDHNARQLLIPEAGSAGDGVMLEAVLGYDITENWNVGIGGRYWAWNLRNGTWTFDFLGGPPPGTPQFARFTAERYGTFVQADYHWGDTTGTTAAHTLLPVKAPVEAVAAVNWTGIYVGGHVGGGVSDDRWSDPFPTAGKNVAGFGDTIHGTGPLGGGQIGADWQAGQWVLGVQADASAADVRGNNTCFTGLSGLDCQSILGSVGTLSGRVGYAWNRSLLYAKAGGAWAGMTYHIDGINNGGVALGTGSTNVTASGWVAGAGLEYALTGNWATMFECDHIDLGSMTMSFPTIAVINAYNISVRQTADVCKLGLNYKLF